MSNATSPSAEVTTSSEDQEHPWQDLPYEHTRLVRLAPQIDNRNPSVGLLRFAQLSRVEQHSAQQSLLRLKLDLPDQQTRRQQNLLEVWVDHQTKTVRLSPEQGLDIEPQDRGLGRFLASQAIDWAQKRFSSYSIESHALSAKDALSDDTRARRDHFLKSLGFEVSYEDLALLKGHCSASHVGVLKAGWNSERVQPVELLDAGSMLQQADRSIRELEIKLRQRDETVSALKREDGTLRFSIACLVAFCTFQAGLLIWMAAR